MRKQVILLNGPSSSGKSTLAKALQALIAEGRSELYEVVSIDDFMKLETTETIYEDDVFEIAGDLNHRILEGMKNAPGVIVDHVITSARIFEQMKDVIYPFSLRLVHVTCPLELLKKREKERGDRCPGSAESSDRYLFPKEGYELTVDTGIISPVENALFLYENLFCGEGINDD